MRRREERELDDEIELHIGMIVDELRAKGWSEVDAEREARRRFGSPEGVRTAMEREWEGRMGRMGRWIDGVRQDVAFALRQLVRRPLTNGLALATLVLGVGSTALVYSVVHAVALRDLPFPDDDRLVRVSQTSPQGREYSVSEANFVDFRRRQTTMVEMAGMAVERPILTFDGQAEGASGMRVSHTFFELLGLDPVLGRVFSAEEDLEGADANVVVISEGEWVRRWGSDPGVLGNRLTVDGTAHTIIGVAPSDEAWPGVGVFTPLAPMEVAQRDNQIMESFGRMRPGVTIEDVQAEMDAIAAELSDQYPESNDGWGASVRPLRSYFVGQRQTRFGGLLMGAVGLLLLMACASITNLRVAQASARRHELRVRAALGARRGRLRSQLLVEGAVLALIAAPLAILLAVTALPVVRALGSSSLGRLGDAAIDAPVLGVALAAGVVTLLVSGLAPALLLEKDGGPGALRDRSSGGVRGRIRGALVAIQFALAVAVVLSAGLMMRSFAAMTTRDLGIEPEGMIAAAIRLPIDRFSPPERVQNVQLLMEELEAIPGVLAAGVTHAPPFGWMQPSNFVALADNEPDRQEDFQPVSWRAVSENYFEAAGLSLLSGRVFDARDMEVDGLQTVVIDRGLADLMWGPGSDPIGERLTWFIPGGQHVEVIGIVEPAQDERMDADARPRIYRSYGWAAWYQPGVVIRVAPGAASQLIPELRATAARVLPSVPLIDPVPVEESMRSVVAWPRFTLGILAAFSLAALVLAAMGVFGVTAFAVTTRRREIGLRIALGARPEGVFALVLRSSLVFAAIGIALGLGIAVGTTRLMESVLYGVTRLDPATWAAVPLLLAAVALAAAWLPARRALRISPRSAMVEE